MFLSFYIAYLLAVVPMPDWAAPYRPEWVAMVLIYWIITLPGRMGIGCAWLAGLLLDILEGGVLGLNALVLTAMAYLALTLQRRLRGFSHVQLGLLLLLLCGGLLLGRWLGTLNGHIAPGGPLFPVAALSSTVVWIPLFWTLGWLKRAAGVT